MEYYEEFYVEIFQFEIQKKHLKCLKNLICLLDFCVKYQLQAYSAKSQNIFAIRPLHSVLATKSFVMEYVLKIIISIQINEC